jgi:hypothetical protein
MIGVNLTGVWKSAKAVAPHMIEQGSGSIVITSSTNGWEAGLNYAHYVIKTPMTSHQGAWDMFAGHEGGTEAEMLEGGYHFAALKGTTFMDPQVIADTALYLNSTWRPG